MKAFSILHFSGKGKVQITENLIKQSDIGIQISNGANSAVRFVILHLVV